MNKCLLIGGGGFIGMHLAKTLIAKNFKVTILSKTGPSDLFKDFLSDDMKKISWNSYGVDDGKLLRKTFKTGIAYVFYLVSTSLPSVKKEGVEAEVGSNLFPLINVLNLSLEFNIEKLLFFSSGGTIYGQSECIPICETHAREPICSYGMQKLILEQFISYYKRVYGLNCISLRIANPYGYGQSNKSQGAISVFLRNILAGNVVNIWGDGTTVRDYIYIDDVIEAIMLLLSYNGRHVAFNIGTGIGATLIDLVDMLSEISNLPVQIIYAQERGIDVPYNVLNTDRIRAETGWTPSIGLKAGIKKIYRG